MANMAMVNEKIKKAFPGLDIVVVRGQGYVYFDGDDGFDKIESIMTNPTTTQTDDLTKMCVDNISEIYA